MANCKNCSDQRDKVVDAALDGNPVEAAKHALTGLKMMVTGKDTLPPPPPLAMNG